MVQVNSKWIRCCDWFVNDSAKAKCKAEAPPNKTTDINRDFLPMPMSYTPQIKLSTEQKYTKLNNNSVLKWNPLVISNTQQCETMEHFWVCPLQREPSAAKYSSCRKYVRGSCAVFVTARQAGAQHPSGCAGTGEKGSYWDTPLLLCLRSTNVLNHLWIFFILGWSCYWSCLDHSSR